MTIQTVSVSTEVFVETPWLIISAFNLASVPKVSVVDTASLALHCRVNCNAVRTESVATVSNQSQPSLIVSFTRRWIYPHFRRTTCTVSVPKDGRAHFVNISTLPAVASSITALIMLVVSRLARSGRVYVISMTFLVCYIVRVCLFVYSGLHFQEMFSYFFWRSDPQLLVNTASLRRQTNVIVSLFLKEQLTTLSRLSPLVSSFASMVDSASKWVTTNPFSVSVVRTC